MGRLGAAIVITACRARAFHPGTCSLVIGVVSLDVQDAHCWREEPMQVRNGVEHRIVC